MSTQSTDSSNLPLHDMMPRPQGGSSRQVVSSSLVILVVLIGVVSYAAFRAGPGVFHGGSKAIASASAAIAPATVNITKTGFVPATISVKVGQAVAWTNTDSSAHFVIANDPKPLSASEPLPNSQQSIGPNSTYSYVFDKAGTYGYHDSLAPSFVGTVVVK